MNALMRRLKGNLLNGLLGGGVIFVIGMAIAMKGGKSWGYIVAIVGVAIMIMTARANGLF